MKVDEHLWNFHVAVAIRNPKDGLIVLDPLQDSPLSYQEWAKKTERMDIKFPNSRVRFYITDPRKFLPAFDQYNVEQLHEPQLKQLFDELLISLK